ncbi:MAG: DUF373 family protein [Candidatus Thermoplasmatota archaeon]|jgi:putative membrane protein|nr:DUF373 family protein [Candidatus Thermoplasmatota archaeon]MCL5963995.1 DUF373 family protein [Candidatus Thermoplasmatota archaeon]
MGKVLVICVDRDDDVGRKTGIKGPIIGKDNNVRAAVALAIADPEDADVNTMFSAISIYDELKKDDKESIEVVTLSGDPKVGVRSDKEIVRQIEEVISKTSATSAILVSDGEEDEFIYPIISSRLNIDSVKRVYIRQNASVEGTYYLITKALKDPKLRQKIIVPIAFILVILGMAMWFNVLHVGVVVLSIILGIYMLVWAYSLDDRVINAIKDIKENATERTLSFTLSIVALTIFIVGCIYGYKGYESSTISISSRYLVFFSNGFWWWIISIWLYEMAGTVEIILEEWRVPRAFWVINITLMAIAITFWSLYSLISATLGYGSEVLPLIYISLILGVSMSVFAAMLRIYFKQKGQIENEI